MKIKLSPALLRLAALSLFSSCLSSYTQAAVEAIIIPPTHVVEADSHVEILLVYTNVGNNVEYFLLPQTIDAQLAHGSNNYPLTLTPSGQLLDSTNDTQSTGSISLASGAQKRVKYRALLPKLAQADGIQLASIQLLNTAQASAQLFVQATRLEAANAVATQYDEQPSADEVSPTESNTTETQIVKVLPIQQSRDEESLRNNFTDNFSAYEPLYFLLGTDPTNAKFQISFKYRFLDQDSDFAKNRPWLSNLYVAYTQTSFWDLESESAPFRDTNFKPEAFYQFNDVLLPSLSDDAYFDFRVGYQHESNGQSGADSRSLNIAYLEPAFHWSISEKYRLTVAPRVWAYAGGTDGNEDIRDFRGRSSLTATLTQDEGFQLEAYLRGNPGTGNGSLQLDASYPISALSFFNLDFYLYGQFFTGYGESLLDYNIKDTRFRLGLGIIR